MDETVTHACDHGTCTFMLMHSDKIYIMKAKGSLDTDNSRVNNEYLEEGFPLYECLFPRNEAHMEEAS